MRKKDYSKGSIILRQGDRVDSIALVKKGAVKIVHKMTKQRTNKLLHLENRRDSVNVSSQTSSEPVEITVDIAEIGPHDLIGVVEAMTNAKKMRNEAYAQSQLEVFYIQTNMFMSFLKHERKTIAHLEKLG
jgi:CRP-like cAMP-binding protein